MSESVRSHEAGALFAHFPPKHGHFPAGIDVCNQKQLCTEISRLGEHRKHILARSNGVGKELLVIVMWSFRSLLQNRCRSAHAVLAVYTIRIHNSRQ